MKGSVLALQWIQISHQKFPHCYAMSTQRAGLVADFSKLLSSSIAWNLHLRRAVREMEMEEIHALLQRLSA